MDWPRAKTILIVSLVFLNGLLYYYGDLRPVLPVPEPTYLTAHPLEPIVEELEVYGVTVDIPEGAPPRLPPVRLVPRTPDVQLDAFFAGEPFETSSGSLGPCLGTLHTGPSHTVCVSDDGWLLYARSQRAAAEPAAPAAPADLVDAQQQAMELLAALGGVPADVDGPEIGFDEGDGAYGFTYAQVIEDPAAGPLWIFPGEIDIRATGREVIRFRRRLWDILPDESPPEAVMPITNLLHRQLMDGDRLVALLERQAAGSVGQRSLRVRLGYALGPALDVGAGGGAGTGPGDDRAIAFEGRPAWQVLLEGEPPLLFDARSGEPILTPVP